jgi:hypothetical protein
MKLFSLLLCAMVLCSAGATAVGAATLNQGVREIPLAELLPGAVFDPAIPTQVAVTGVNPGQRPLRPDEVLRFFRALAEASPRAQLREFGHTYEGRPLVALIVSEAATVAELEAFQARHTTLLDPRLGGVPAAEELKKTKAVAWMAYGIHGDELSSTDAAAVLAYWLVAGTDARAVRLRERLVVLIDPCENPDGRTRYLAQTTSFAHRVANPDQDDLSHRAVWPWGRGNHYLFDMNRDWFTMLLPESVRSREISSWMPQMLVDSHEMGANASYLFPPPRHPFNPHLPANTGKWEEPFSAAQARALDQRGYPYFSGEWNEEFFPGYGSSWASYHGAIGILYEMSRTSGTLVRKRNGTVRTFAQAVEHQVTSSVANLTTLAENAAEILADQIAGRQQSVRAGKEGPVGAWVFPPDERHPGRLPAFARRLQDQGIEVQVLPEGAATEAKLTDARSGMRQEVALPAGTLLVTLAQPSGSLARVLLDPHVPMSAAFFREEREYLEKGKGSRLYDTTAWSLPLLRGVPAYWGAKAPRGDWQVWPASAPAGTRPGDDLGAARYYIIDGDPDTTPPALAALLQQEVTVRVAEKAFTLAGHSFRRGALILQQEGNRDDLIAVTQDLIAAHGVQVVAVGTADAQQGPDLGGSHYKPLVAPRVGVLTGMPISPADYGFVWHLLDQDLKLRFSALDIGAFRRVDLSRYNVLIFPPVWGGTGLYRQVLGDEGLERLRRWIEAGGTAIGLGGGARLLADKEVGLTQARFRDQVVQEYPAPVWSITALEAEGAGRPTAVGVRVAPTADDKDKSDRADVADTSGRDSPYDVAPVLGAGALPFARGYDQGTPLAGEPLHLDQWVAPVLPPGQKTATESDRERVDARLRRLMPQGALLRAELDDDFWLGYGLPPEITVWFGGHDPLIAAPPVAVAAEFVARDRLHLGGLLWPEAAARLAHTAYATREAVGRGQVILFADHPGYRRWVVETERLLKNAILLGPGLGTRWSAPW